MKRYWPLFLLAAGFVLPLFIPPGLMVLFTAAERLAGAQTRVDIARQATNVPITNQTTQLQTIFEPSKQVTPPAAPGLPCASGTWATNESHLFLCFQPRPDNSFGWVRIATEKY